MNPELLKMLACPKCHSSLELRAAQGDAPDAERLVCTKRSCSRSYPIKDGIPVLLVESAERPSSEN